MTVIFLGPPGSGKGTQAQQISKEKGWPQLSTGDMLRAAMRNQTELGVKAKEFVDRGDLVPDDLVVGLIQERIQEPDCKAGFILDGFPRTIPQAEALDKMLADNSRKIDRSVLFEIDPEVIVGRLSGRRTCAKCSSIFHTEANPPKVADVCDSCGSALNQRKDDQEEVVRKRLKVYDEQTAPVVQYYEKNGAVRKIDAAQDIKVVHEKLHEALS